MDSSTGQFALVTSVAACFVPTRPAILKSIFRRNDSAKETKHRARVLGFRTHLASFHPYRTACSCKRCTNSPLKGPSTISVSLKKDGHTCLITIVRGDVAEVKG